MLVSEEFEPPFTGFEAGAAEALTPAKTRREEDIVGYEKRSVIRVSCRGAGLEDTSYYRPLVCVWMK